MDLRTSVDGLSADEQYDICLKLVEEVEPNHGGQATKVVFTDSEGSLVEMPVFRNSPARDANWTEDIWYLLEDAKVKGPKDDRLIVSAIGATSATEIGPTLALSEEFDPDDDWEFTGWTTVVTPTIVLPDGRLLVNQVDHPDISTIVITEGTPCATYRIRFSKGEEQIGIAEPDEVLAPPPEGDRFMLGIDTTSSNTLRANENLMKGLSNDIQSNLSATVELEILYKNDVGGCKVVNPGLVPFEGNIVPITDSSNGDKVDVDDTHDDLPDHVIEPTAYEITLENPLDNSMAFVEITGTTSNSVSGKPTDKEYDPGAVDPRFVEFENPELDIDNVQIYFCGVYGDDTESTCPDFFQEELFGSPSKKGASDGDTLLLKDYKRDFNNDGDSTLYGPFTADGDEGEMKEDVWGGRFENQVRVDSKDLFMIPVPELVEDLGRSSSLENATARNVLAELCRKGTPVETDSQGEIEEIDSDPIKPPTDEYEKDDEEDNNDEDDPETSGEDLIDPVIHILMNKELSEPMEAKEALQEAANPGDPLLQAAVDGELRPELYERALTHLVAGKNLILYGPPGSGKTRIAERLGHGMTSRLHIEAANAEWTYQDVVGGYTPSSDGGFKPKRGVLTKAAACCEKSLEDHNHPDWLIIDELNRANMDEAFGDVFTLLDLDHRSDSDITYADGCSQAVPLSFRILGTMNTEDQAQLFSLGYAFRRRFAFIEVPPAFEQVTAETSPTASRSDLSLEPEFEQLLGVLEPAAMSHFEPAESENTPCELEADTTVGIPPLAEIIEFETILDEAVEDIQPKGGSLEFPNAILWFVQTLAENEVVEIGQGIILDTIRCVVAHYALFPTRSDWRIVDHAVSAYILPQLESYMSELRRAETVANDSDAGENFEAVIQAANEIGLASTAEALETAIESHEILQ